MSLEPDVVPNGLRLLAEAAGLDLTAAAAPDVDKENGPAMDLSKTSPVAQPDPPGPPQPAPSTERISAFTPTHPHSASLPHHLASQFRLMSNLPDIAASRAGHLPSDPAAAYNALATANLIANLAANNQSVANYLCGLNAQHNPYLGLAPRLPVAPSAFSPSASNPVLKELISASVAANRPSVEHPRQSPDTTTGRDPVPDFAHARAAVLAEGLLQGAPMRSPSLPDSATIPRASTNPAVAIPPLDAIAPPANLKDCLSQLSVQVPSGVLSSGPNSQCSGPEKGKDGRYLERRRRNNEAAKRCRANRRALFEYRFKRSQELELENTDLKNQISKLRSELSNLQELMKARGMPVEPIVVPERAAAPPIPPPPVDHPADHESGHESDFSSNGDSHPDEAKKAESMVSWATSSPESGVGSPMDQGPAPAPEVE